MAAAAGAGAGPRVLITGGAGGVGIHAIQIAEQLFRASYVATTASASPKAELCTRMGADRVVDYRSERFEDMLSGANESQLFDAVLYTTGEAAVYQGFAPPPSRWATHYPLPKTNRRQPHHPCQRPPPAVPTTSPTNMACTHLPTTPSAASRCSNPAEGCAAGILAGAGAGSVRSWLERAQWPRSRITTGVHPS